jgi:peptidoglycan/xylan/chitin deacetylase (PgdA/CDA1 family)
MDHDLYHWSPLPFRSPLRWPDNAQVALCVVVNLEHYDFEPPAGAHTLASVPGGRGRGPSPDIAIYSLREYGKRIGIFRVMEVLDRYGLQATVAIDAVTAANYPFIVRECQKRNWEFVGHGHSITQTITSRMSEQEERQHIRTALDIVRDKTGAAVEGWFSPEYSESFRTPGILAELGVRYLLDWPNDEQPYRMTVPNADLVSLPTLVELDDVYAHWHRRVTIWRWQRMVQEAFETLHADGAKSGRLMTLSLHPWLIGQAHRIKSLDHALAAICSYNGVWKATGRQIADHYRQQC